MNKILSILSSIYLAGCATLGIRTSNEAPYTVVHESGNIQIRAYEPLLIAETVIEADYAASGSIGFNRLAGFILVIMLTEGNRNDNAGI